MAKYKFVAVLSAPDTTEVDKVIDEVFADKHGLHKVENEMIHSLLELQKITAKELESGKKEFGSGSDKTLDPQTVLFKVHISKDDGFEFASYNFRWPNQTVAARQYLRGMFDGIAKTAKQVSKEKPGK